MQRAPGALTAVVAFGLVAAGAAAGGTAMLSSSDDPRTPPLRSGEVVLAVGEDRLGGPWRLTAHPSEAIVADGEEIQPAGLPCLQFVLLQPRGNGFAGNGQCGTRDDGFMVMGVHVEDNRGHAGVILWGTVPECASGVQLTAIGRQATRAATIDGPTAYEGDVWVMPASADMDGARVDWLDAYDNPAGHSREVGSIIARGG